MENSKMPWEPLNEPCPKCGKLYLRKAHLTKVRNDKHPIKCVYCWNCGTTFIVAEDGEHLRETKPFEGIEIV